MASADHKAKIDANVLEAIAEARPDDMFLKGSGVLKLIDAIRNLERENRELLARAAQPPRAPVATEATKLPAWWDNFILNVCEIPDRNSPEDEPDAMVATAEELEACALNAMEGFRTPAATEAPSDAEIAQGLFGISPKEWAEVEASERATPAPAVGAEPIYAVMLDGKRIATASLRENADYAAHTSPRAVVVPCQLVPLASAAQHVPSLCASLTCIHKAIDAFEQRERSIAQAHIAAKLVKEMRAAVAQTGKVQ